MQLLHAAARTRAVFDDPNLLAHAGLAPLLALAGRAGQARNLPGRPKTDKEDARWIARLTEMGCCGPRSCRRRRSGRCGCIPGISGT